MKWSELMQSRCSLFHANLELYLKEVWKSVLGWCFSGLQSRKENRKGRWSWECTWFYFFVEKEDTNESNNECTNPLLILLFHMNNHPEDGVLQWMEEPAVSASVSGYASILLHKIKRKYLTSHTISFVKLVFLKYRLRGLLVLYVLFCPSYSPVLKCAVTNCELAVNVYVLIHFSNKFINVLTHLRHAYMHIQISHKQVRRRQVFLQHLCYSCEAGK